ncbi:class IIb bacteriocin, lactobin A/cerein 7B family [Cereibacter sp. SYSU M97828]|nr:class IIb bacteriocin, lactobin A/cerein 7B family [Cereibacter flavus]
MNDLTIHELDDANIDAVSGGVLPVAWAIAAVFTGAGAGGVTFGYMVGKDRAERDNRAN